ncbi:MAG: glycerol kinase [Sandaracinus sp.]|nr:glycerol kinase [Sandaracinus sp.]|tara:strand:- start:2153 stop:3646 length:1494 start_codon:yes stop_codon:yes gene_type:complete
MSGFLLAIDQGTTGTTAVVLSASDANVVAKANYEFKQHFPHPGWVEHDLGEIWDSVEKAIADALAQTKFDPRDCRGIGITNQRETTVVWERATGRPIHRAIVWQDRRTADICASLREAGHEADFRAKTGLLFDPYFSGTKVKWILDQVEGSRSRGDELCVGTIDSWLVHRLSGGAAHVTDATNASRTLLFDIVKGQWGPGLCDVLQVPQEMLPEVRSCAEVYAETRGLDALPDGIPIAGMAGDQQAALFGQTCFEPGDAKCTYGTGAFLLANVGEEFREPPKGLLTTIAWRLGDTTTYAFEGSSFIAGAAVQWLRDELGLITTAAEVEEKARRVESAEELVFVPALTGLGAPHWDPHARGLIMGIGRDTTAGHICRATLDGIAHQIVDLVQAMIDGGADPLNRLRVDGGASANDLLMQIQADLLEVVVDRPANIETTALGAAYLAGLGAGVFPNTDAIRAAHTVERSFEPSMESETRAKRLDRWNDAIRRARSSFTG